MLYIRLLCDHISAPKQRNHCFYTAHVARLKKIDNKLSLMSFTPPRVIAQPSTPPVHCVLQPRRDEDYARKSNERRDLISPLHDANMAV